jgi:hypothetical protein
MLIWSFGEGTLTCTVPRSTIIMLSPCEPLTNMVSLAAKSRVRTRVKSASFCRRSRLRNSTHSLNRWKVCSIATPHITSAMRLLPRPDWCSLQLIARNVETYSSLQCVRRVLAQTQPPDPEAGTGAEVKPTPRRPRRRTAQGYSSRARSHPSDPPRHRPRSPNRWEFARRLAGLRHAPQRSRTSTRPAAGMGKAEWRVNLARDHRLFGPHAGSERRLLLSCGTSALRRQITVLDFHRSIRSLTIKDCPHLAGGDIRAAERGVGSEPRAELIGLYGR